MTFKFELERGSRKHFCPACGRRTFVRYVDIQKREYLHEEFGRCDREQSCSYHLKPGKEQSPPATKSKIMSPERVCIPRNLFIGSRVSYERNSFVKYLMTLFDAETVRSLVQHYHIGTSSHGCIFWFIDHEGNIQAGMIKRFDESGHTVHGSETWVHAVLKNQPWATAYARQERKLNCLFGAHLLNLYPKMPIALCEAPKTAVIASAYYPEFTWMAVFNKSSLQDYKTNILKGRKVTLFPDLNATYEWKKYGDERGFNTNMVLEGIATEDEKKLGLDLADYVARYSLKQFQAAKEVSKPSR